MAMEEIIKGLRRCADRGGCEKCPYEDTDKGICIDNLMYEAADLIESLQAQLAERDKEIERLREAIASVHKSLDFADSQRQSCKNYTELAINNGLALGRIAVTLKHDFKEPLPAPPEKGE